MKRYFNIILSFLWCVILSCGDKISNPPKDTPDPTKPTQSGKNLIVFKVNGEFHIYQGKTTQFDDNGVYFSLVTVDGVTGLIIQAEHTKYDDKLKLYIKATYPNINIPYKITQNIPVVYSQYYIGNGNEAYFADSNSSAITFTRSDSGVISGNFEFVGKRDSFPDVLITEGWFDIAR